MGYSLKLFFRWLFLRVWEYLLVLFVFEISNRYCNNYLFEDGVEIELGYDFV